LLHGQPGPASAGSGLGFGRRMQLGTRRRRREFGHGAAGLFGERAAWQSRHGRCREAANRYRRLIAELDPHVMHRSDRGAELLGESPGRAAVLPDRRDQRPPGSEDTCCAAGKRRRSGRAGRVRAVSRGTYGLAALHHCRSGRQSPRRHLPASAVISTSGCLPRLAGPWAPHQCAVAMVCCLWALKAGHSRYAGQKSRCRREGWHDGWIAKTGRLDGGGVNCRRRSSSAGKSGLSYIASQPCSASRRARPAAPWLNAVFPTLVGECRVRKRAA